MILRESRRAGLAHEFLNFLLVPEVAAANARAGDTATACGLARALLPNDPVMYPPEEIYRHGFWPMRCPPPRSATGIVSGPRSNHRKP